MLLLLLRMTYKERRIAVRDVGFGLSKCGGFVRKRGGGEVGGRWRCGGGEVGGRWQGGSDVGGGEDVVEFGDERRKGIEASGIGGGTRLVEQFEERAAVARAFGVRTFVVVVARVIGVVDARAVDARAVGVRVPESKGIGGN